MSHECIGMKYSELLREIEGYAIDWRAQFNLDKRYKSQNIDILFDTLAVIWEHDFCEVKLKIVCDIL